MTNYDYHKACKNVGIEPSNRQWRKWLAKKGIAYKCRNFELEGNATKRNEQAKLICNTGDTVSVRVGT